MRSLKEMDDQQFVRAKKDDLHYTGQINGKTYVVPHAFDSDGKSIPIRYHNVVSPNHVLHNNPTLTPEEMARVSQHIKDIHSLEEGSAMGWEVRKNGKPIGVKETNHKFALDYWEKRSRNTGHKFTLHPLHEHDQFVSESLTGPTRMQLQKHFEKEQGTVRQRLNATEKAHGVSGIQLNSTHEIVNWKQSMREDAMVQEGVWMVTDHLGHTHEVEARDHMEAKKKVVSVGGVHPKGIPMTQWHRVKVQPKVMGEENASLNEFRDEYGWHRELQTSRKPVPNHAYHASSDAELDNLHRFHSKKAQETLASDPRKAKRHQEYADNAKQILGYRKGLHESEQLTERTLSGKENAKKEEIVKSMKKNKAGFTSRYGDRAKEVMYATATKKAKALAEDVETLGEAQNFMTTYRRNESQNRHTQNVVHLAKHFGNETDKAQANFFLDELKKHGHNKHTEASYKLHEKLWPKAVAAHASGKASGRISESERLMEAVKKPSSEAEVYRKARKESQARNKKKESDKEEHSATFTTVKKVLNEVFTRKHFRQVAYVIKSHPDEEKRKALAAHHTEIFSKSNPRFDKKRFYAAANAPLNEDSEQLDELQMPKFGVVDRALLGGSPKETVRSVHKMSLDTLKSHHATARPAPKNSPRDWQQRAVKRQLERRGHATFDKSKIIKTKPQGQ